MKTIVFLHPPMTLNARYGELAEAGAMEPPFGLCSLAAVAREQGYRTFIVDAEALGLSVEEAAQQVLQHSPDYVGITATTPAIVNAAKIAQVIRDDGPHPLLILGGVHVTAIPEETLEEFPAFDMAVVGEGETTLLELLHHLDQGLDLGTVKGLALRRDGRIVRTLPRALIKDLDTLPMPAFDLLPPLQEHYGVTAQSVDRLPAISLITSRGCYAKCTFCDTNVTGNTMRGHSAQYVIAMMRLMHKRYGMRCVMFEDDNFLAFRKRIREMEGILKHDPLDMTWSCTSRVDIANAETLAAAKRLGCWQIFYGVETASQKILDFYKKQITPQQAQNAIEMTKKAGLHTKGFVIIGNPLETIETLEETREFVKRVPLDDISITYFTPYPGAEVFNTCERYGEFDRNWEKLSCFEIVFIPHGLNHQILEDYQRRIFREFYMRAPIVFGYLKRIKTPRHFLDLANSGWSLMKHVYVKPSRFSYSVR